MANDTTASILERRLSQRVSAPIGTTALIKNRNGYLDTLYVSDICVVGILANGYIKEEKYPVDTLIQGILLNIPPCDLGVHNRISLLIGEGKIIHTLIDKVSKTVCYGIEFLNHSHYVYTTLDKLVKKLKTDPRSPSSEYLAE